MLAEDLPLPVNLYVYCTTYVKGLQSRGATIEELEAFDITYPLIQQMLVKHINHFDFTNSTAKNVLRYEIENEDGELEFFWSYFLREAIEELQEIIWFCDNRAEIEWELQAVKDRRLMELMQNEKPGRAFDDLHRNFYRTLSELHKHQEWRRKIQVVDVDSRNVIDSGEEGAAD